LDQQTTRPDLRWIRGRLAAQEDNFPMMLEAIAPNRLYRQIADRITALIATGEFPAGTRLPPERALAEQLHVSRTSVREALIALELGGLIDIRMGSGIYVKAPAPPTRVPAAAPSRAAEDTGPFEQLRARWLIEGETAALAARNATAADIKALRELNRELHRSPPEARIPPDRRFHVRIAEASGNSALALVVEYLWQLRESPLFAQIERHFHTPELSRQTIDDHTAVVDAIAAHDPAAARRAMRAHLNRVNREFARGLQPARARQGQA
jgi:DNA-binding FadR family transcriptional regulator